MYTIRTIKYYVSLHWYIPVSFCHLVIMKCKYRVRKFSSKGAFLVLSWTMLISNWLTSCHIPVKPQQDGLFFNYTIRLLAYYIKYVLLTSLFEFMCAQSPYNMRGLLLSLAVPIILVSYVFSQCIGLLFWNK